MKPLVSVVTPSWNQGRYFPDCIESVSGLEDGLVEHIVIDNCSDDETPEVISQNPHLRALVEKDRGQSDALNKGFEMARGDWILWLNADDFLYPGMLSAYVDMVRSKPSLDAVYGHMVFVDENGAEIRTVYQPQWRYYMTRLGPFCLPSTGTLYRASLLKENPLDLDFHMVMDTEWTLRNGAKMKAKRLRQKAVGFRLADNKTAENIATGALTPRHAEERKILSGRYRFYGLRGESRLGAIPYAFLWLVRRGIRFRILVDKASSLLLDRIKNR